MEKFILNKIQFEENGRKVCYDYEISKGISKFFDLDNKFYVRYDRPVEDVPENILVIPLLVNILPISWFVGFNIQIEELDRTFYKSMQTIKAEFERFHDAKIKNSNLHVSRLDSVDCDFKASGLLFSGGLDSYDTLIRNIDKDPFLFSIHGADIKINDAERWQKFKKYNADEPIINSDKLVYIESNLRKFYTYRVELLAGLGWWGEVQHGMALLGVIAPISFLEKIKYLHIASSNTKEVDFSWGSTPEIDETLSWTGMSVIHDGYDQRRTDKVENIVRYSRSNNIRFKLRVCYADERSNYNCNRCAKCQRTMLGLILCNADPKQFGFDVPRDFYDLIFQNFEHTQNMTIGIKYEWECLQEKAIERQEFFVVNNRDDENHMLNRFTQIEIDYKDKISTRQLHIKKLKFILKNKYRGVYNLLKDIKG